MAGFERPLDLAQQLIAVYGSPQFLGTITTAGASAVDNSNTAVPFTIVPGAVLLLQPDADVYLKAQTAAATAVTTTNGVLVASKEKFTIMLTGAVNNALPEKWISILRVGGSDLSVKVWQLA
jgi:hypothetical protein